MSMEGSPETGDLRKRVDEAFDQALDLGADEAEAFLEELLARDPAVHAEVTALLSAHARTEGLLEDEAIEAVASMASDALQSIRIGPYRTIREIGRGGMALVYLAERADGQYEQHVAIKLIRGRPDALELHRRFLAERQILASLDHPNIGRLLDGGLSPSGFPYLVMEYVDGLPITDYCDRHRLSVDERLRLFRAVCDAVHYAHRNLIIHRDLKPTNILVTAGGTPKLLDFGIAKLLDKDLSAAPITRTDHRIMTPEYASPEQVQGSTLTTASDVYGLGILLYEMLCGHRPYRLSQRPAAEVLTLVCEKDPERPSTRVLQHEQVPGGDGATHEIGPEEVSAARNLSVDRLRRRLQGDLDNIVMKALRKEPTRRYVSAELLGQDIDRYLSGLPVIAHRGSAWYRAGKFLRRYRAQSAAAALAAVSLLVGLGAAVWQGRVAARERDRAEAALAQAEQALRQSLEVKDFLITLFEANDPMEARGATPTAGDLLARGVDRVAELEGQPSVQAEMLDAIGRVYQSLGRFEDALPYLAQALDLRREVFGDADPVVAESLDRMGTILRLTGRYREAEPYFRESVALSRQLLGPYDARVATVLNNLSVLLRTVGEYEEAETLALEALGVWEQALEGPDPELAFGLRNLGWLRSLQGDDVGAEAYYRRALDMRVALHGERHPDVAGMQILLADLFLARDDWQAAEPLYRDALDTRRTFLGEAHPYTASALNNLGLATQAKGDPAGAEVMHRQAIAAWEAALGREHAYYAWGLNDLSMATYAQGRLDEAERLQLQSLALRRRLLGDDHPDVALSLHNLGMILAARGQLRDARAHLEEALAMRRGHFGSEHPDVSKSLRELAVVNEQLGRSDDAVTMLEEALALSRDYFGDDHGRTRTIYADLIRVHERRGDREAAARYRRLAQLGA
jgi:serine/threonine-protein kinase